MKYLKTIWKKLFTPIFNVARSFLFVTRKFDFTLAIGIVASLALLQPDQAKDLFNDLSASGFQYDFILFTFLVTLWSVLLWLTPRFILRFTHIEMAGDDDRFERFFIKWVPRVMGILPFCVVFSGFWNAEAEGGEIRAWGFAVLGFIMFLFFILRRTVYQKAFGTEFADRYAPESRFWRDRESICDIIQLPLNIMVAITIILLNALYFMFATLSIDSFFILIKPGSVLVLAFAGWTGIGSIVDTFSNKYKTPVILGVMIVLILFSTLNNNHTIRKAQKSTVIPAQRPDMETYAYRWLKNLYSRSDTDHQIHGFPVIIVASEGGGIRSTFWTTNLLSALDRHIPGFNRHVFAMSGVSGGNVGEVFYQALLADRNRESKISENAPEILGSADYLSPITSALLYPDLIQRFLPFPVERWDRARWLEDQFAYVYRNTTGYNTLGDGFLSMWNLDEKEPRYDLPCLFLNATHSETGRKAVFSNVDLNPRFFPDVVDVFETTGYDIPLKVTTSVCSRFPLLTPPALVRDASGKKWGHLVDGGYYENTGLETAFQLLRFIHNYNSTGSFEGMEKIRGKLRPIIIFIKNGQGNQDKEAISSGYELKTITGAFLNAWGGAGIARDELTNGNVSEFIGESYFKFELDRHSVMLPLGWYLSEIARKELSRQVSAVFEDSTSLRGARHHENYKSLKAAIHEHRY